MFRVTLDGAFYQPEMNRMREGKKIAKIKRKINGDKRNKRWTCVTQKRVQL